MESTNEKQRDEMFHALGLNIDKPFDIKKTRRNYFYINKDNKLWNDLVTKGFATRDETEDNDAYFHVSEKGKAFLKKGLNILSL